MKGISRSAGVAYLLIAHGSTPCLADIHAFRCIFDGQAIYFTQYSDGTPARVGTAVGIGDQVLTFRDKSGAFVFIEKNIDGTPVTLTTIDPSLRGTHSRHSLGFDGKVVAPSQAAGQCVRVQIR